MPRLRYARAATESDGAQGGDSQKARRPLRARRGLWVGVGLGGALILAWGGIAVATTQHVFGDAALSGVNVGGMNASAARSQVSKSLEPGLAKAVTVTAGKHSAQIVPAKAGVSVDAGASVRKLTGFTLNPVTLAERLAGPQLQAVARVDAAALTTTLEEQSGALSSGMRNASIAIEGTTPVLTKAQAGRGVDVPASVKRLAARWPLGATSITLVEGDTEPAITDAAAQALIDDELTPLLSGDLTITAAGTSAEADAPTPATLTPAILAPMVTLTDSGEKITASLDAEKLRAAVLQSMPGLEKTASDAHYTIEGNPNGTPAYVAGTAGRILDAAALAKDAYKAGTSGSERNVLVPLAEQAPEHNESAEELGVTQIVGEYATTYFADAARNQNLAAGTAAINGTLIRPGGTFSLEGSIGPVDAAHGFTASGVVVNGEHSTAMGGGLSQVATTTFNAAFEAGMDDVEHHPHSMWFRRYPPGREATLWTGNLDVKWKNSTPYAALVQAYLAGGQVHVRIWSTPYYQVNITSGEKTNIRPVTVKKITSGSCTPYSGGQAGFDIVVTRTRTAPDGTSPEKDVLSTHYQADHAIECVTPGSEGEATAGTGS